MKFNEFGYVSSMLSIICLKMSKFRKEKAFYNENYSRKIKGKETNKLNV